MSSLISVVVTAPHGFDDCVYLDELLLAADGKSLEIIVADSSFAETNRSQTGLRHVRAPGVGLYALINEGIHQSAGEWVVVTEDHCRFLPGFIEAYREAIRRHPDVDLFSGSVDNLTSSSPWASAIFVTGLHRYWPELEKPPQNATNANLMVRRSAILASELAVDAGLLNLTVPRLIAAGRYAHCRDAVVDHVLHLSCLEAIKFEFNCAGGAREVVGELHPRPLRPVVLFRDFAHNALFSPLRKARDVSGTSQSGMAATLRLVTLGIAAAAATLAADLKRAMRTREVKPPESKRPILQR
jgi:hypothetical protein